MDRTSEKFVDYAATLSYAELTSAAVHAVKRSVLDSVGCALGAFDAQPSKALRKLAARVTATHPATVIGTQIRTTPDLAALTSGAMIRYSDFSDDYFGGDGDTGPHPSDNIGGMLAATESAGADGKTLILGTAIAYEVCGQLVDHTALRVRGWDHPLFHSVASALAGGRILALSREQLGHALGLAIVPNVCLYQTRLGDISNWKGLAGPNGSRNGLFAALLAQEGITGPSDSFEGRAGFMHQLDNRFELGAFGGRGAPFLVESTYFKCLPLRYEMQLPVWVALDLRTRVNIQDLASICVYLEKRSIFTRAQNPAHWDPKTRETADHSGPYLIAAALVDGAITEQTFTPQRFRDPAILDLVQKIRLEEDQAYTAAFPRTFHCRIEATLKSSAVVAVHKVNPKGHPANPMSDRELEEKFLKQVAGVLPEPQSRQLLDQLWELEKLDNMSRLFALMVLPRQG